MSQEKKPGIDTLEGIIERWGDLRWNHLSGSQEEEMIYCPKCGRKQRHSIRFTYPPHGINWDLVTLVKRDPIVLIYLCLNCRSYYTVLTYLSEGEPKLVLLPNTMGGMGTENTNLAVKYYLDQAFKSKIIGALSAAASMFRAALEMLLYNEGFKEGMLGEKINKLNKDINDGTAPKWAMDLQETEMLELMNKIASGAIHPNDGDIERQQVIDNELLLIIEDVFMSLLHMVYEVPARKKASLVTMRSASVKLRKPKEEEDGVRGDA